MPLLQAERSAEVGAKVLDLLDLAQQGRVDLLLVRLLFAESLLGLGHATALLGLLGRALASEELGLGAARSLERGRLEVGVVELVVNLGSVSVPARFADAP